MGAPVSSTSGPQLEMPIDIIGYYADLLKTYEFTEDLGNRDAFGMTSHRWVEKEAAGVVSAIVAYNYPVSWRWPSSGRHSLPVARSCSRARLTRPGRRSRSAS